MMRDLLLENLKNLPFNAVKVTGELNEKFSSCISSETV